MNDPYMPIEAELQITRRALSIIESAKFPVHIITKSNLVSRDADILQSISKTYAAVSFTITTESDDLSSVIEPHASVSSDRFKALSQLASKGIYTGVTFMPILPFINDTKENVENILKMAKDAGASYVLPMFGVTMRKGSRDYFYRMLDENFKGIKEKYISHFGESYECFSPNYRILDETFRELAYKLNMDSKIEFYTPPADPQLSLF